MGEQNNIKNADEKKNSPEKERIKFIRKMLH